MESVWGWIAVPLGVLIGTVWLTRIVLHWLQKRAILDHPVERSSHRVAVPRGGGLALVPLVLAGWLVLAATGNAVPGTLAIVAIGAALALLSWRDDIGGLSVAVRLAGHVCAAAVGVAFLPPDGFVFQGWLPFFLDRAAAVLVWAWFVNLTNFMDGIDGITGVETIAIGAGIATVLAVAGAAGDGLAMPALALAAGAAGFLCWNWPPARIFLGDVGSVPLGFLLGWLLLGMAAKGLWAPALILPLYYLADATLTLAMRMARREPFWRAHRLHFYQRALGAGADHRAVLWLVLDGDVVLVALAALAVVWPWPALALAVVATGVLLAQLARRARA